MAVDFGLAVLKALERYGHHDHDCPAHDVFTEGSCECGFNDALTAARRGEAPETKPLIPRQR